MGYSIELYFARDFEEKLHAVWDALEKAGVPSIMRAIGSRPHLSLLVLDRCEADHVAQLIEAGIKGRCKFPITFPAISLIPGEQQAICLTPSVNPGLVSIQSGLYGLLNQKGFRVRDHYAPDNWLAHCSVSKELSAMEALKTLEVCQNSMIAGKTWITEVGFIKFRPRQVIQTFALKD